MGSIKGAGAVVASLTEPIYRTIRPTDLIAVGGEESSWLSCRHCLLAPACLIGRDLLTVEIAPPFAIDRPDKVPYVIFVKSAWRKSPGGSIGGRLTQLDKNTRFAMLVLSRKEGEMVVIGDCVTVTVLEVSGGRVKLGFGAPADVRIRRDEIQARATAESVACLRAD